jgi:hypothetical protein
MGLIIKNVSCLSYQKGVRAELNCRSVLAFNSAQSRAQLRQLFPKAIPSHNNNLLNCVKW